MVKETETHPDEYYFERIDVFDDALVRSSFWGGTPGGRGHFSVVKSHEDRCALFCEKPQNS